MEHKDLLDQLEEQTELVVGVENRTMIVAGSSCGRCSHFVEGDGHHYYLPLLRRVTHSLIARSVSKLLINI